MAIQLRNGSIVNGAPIAAAYVRVASVIVSPARVIVVTEIYASAAERTRGRPMGTEAYHIPVAAFARGAGPSGNTISDAYDSIRSQARFTGGVDVPEIARVNRP